MAKYSGMIGFAETSETASPGVWEEVITERFYRGNVLQEIGKIEPGTTLNDNINVQNRISIIADLFAYQNFHAMRYVTWMGIKWKVTKIDIKRPRLILSIGGIYNE